MKNKKRFMVFDNKDSHEYDIFVEETDKDEIIYSLHASNHSEWTEHTKGKVLLRLTDDGWEINFKKSFKKLEYNEAQYLTTLLTFIQKYNQPHYNSFRFVPDESFVMLTV